MRRSIPVTSLVVSLALTLFCGMAAAQQVEPSAFLAQPAAKEGDASLKVCLRLQDDSPFIGSASVHVMPSQGYEAIGTPTESDGEMIFSNLAPGTYMVETSAPGFLSVRQSIQIEAGQHLHTLFVIMKPKPLPAAALETSPAEAAPDAARPKTSWLPPGLDDVVPEVRPGIECPLPVVLRGAGQRMKQLASNLEKFSATERVQHYTIDSLGGRHFPENRSFDYVVIVSQTHNGLILLDEYRDGTVDPGIFPARIATMGLPAMALVFHPLFAADFHFRCEGLGEWDGKPAWQIHFVQREDRPNRMRQYRVGGTVVPVPIKGRAWIDAASYQVLRLESELVHPIKEIGLTYEHLDIEYKPVTFHTHAQKLWLPAAANIYAERAGKRYFRTHTFLDFKIFAVDTDQRIQPPKESYAFTNTTDQDITGVLTVTPLPGKSLHAVTIKFTIPAGASVFKFVGMGKDVGMPVDLIGNATFVHNGPANAVRADAFFVKESSLDVVSDPSLPINRS
ncbi:MAG: carboxypeptidase-like regulatory domain-containing protein [Candidatus Acidiferrales bacterium]